jgi:AcrR family transcriptional regulator
MSESKNNPVTKADTSTEEKIKEAARVVFTQKGYAATKVRDIAAEADINLSLVNYYFRSKERLFELIMLENVQKLFAKIEPVINNETTTILEKIEAIVNHYIDLLLENLDFPIFVVNEIMSGANKIPALASRRETVLNSHLAKQILELKLQGKIDFHPVQLIMNVTGMIIFPFFGRPLFIKTGTLDAQEFRQIMEERKKLIPIWMKQIMNL